eukprot:m.20082 g.20082  ORF g.20082 m.20082 type:complete len:351 (-) comp10998_c0_seq1:101-1153(-)
MGNFLEKPLVDKDTHMGDGNGLSWGLSSMQGWRVEMEDAHIASTDIEGLPGCSFFAVFDGHGGKTVSTICGQELISAIMSTTILDDAANKVDSDVLSKALKQALFDLDTRMRAEDSDLDSCKDRSGSTAICVFVSPTHIIFGNCGDSRAVLSRGGEVAFATDDHKPTNAGETARVKAAGGTIEMARVCGNLAVSRSLGDYTYKDRSDLPPEQQKISAEADMTIMERKPSEDEFLLVACDGIYDVMTNKDAIDFIRNQIKAGYTPAQTSERLLDYCLHLDSKDNMSAIVVLLDSAPKAESGFEAPETIPNPSEVYAPTSEEQSGQPSSGDEASFFGALQAIMTRGQKSEAK